MKTYNVGLIGAGFMAKAHSLAYAGMPMCFWPAPALINKKTIADLTQERADEAAVQFAFEKGTDDWTTIINDPDIDIVDICTPNNVHAEIAVAAAKAGKHIICEKPIATTAEEAKTMYEAASKAGVVNMLAFNYRMTPAVQLAKKYIEEGSIGDILDFRGTYLQDWSADPNSPLSWRFQKKVCGSGAFGDIGTHVVDMLRFLIGDFAEVNARFATYIDERPIQTGAVDNLGTVKGGSNVPKAKVDVDDQCLLTLKCTNGAFGTIEATRNAWGRNNFITFEIHGTKGSLYFNYERRDELQVCFADDPADRRGFRTVYTGPAHPFGENLWPIPALGIGYTETKIVEVYKFIDAIVNGKDASPNFKDGYQIELLGDAAFRSAESGKWEQIAGIK
ncbi:MAG: Gfo/Idh/MocA family oxidoreductase [Clostridiales Family XIII bacterium]|jgi:predicted dehydrogenase|nr:Gfo/Idh/MocA family oxidoreductase [Clostridiales Family XIII bacterium]